MYQFQYNYLLRSGNHPNSPYQNETVLTARFSFNKEVAPNKRQEVRKRCSLEIVPAEDTSQMPTLDYFLKKLNYRPEGSILLIGQKYFNGREVVRITPFLWGPVGFNLRSESIGQLDLDKMISLDAINEFILHG